MKTESGKARAAGLALAVLATARLAAAADELAITRFDNGYLSWTNANPALYYRVEFKPSLTATQQWDGTYSGLKNIRSAAGTVTVPVGVFYRVVGSAETSDAARPAPVPKTGAGDLASYTEVAGEDGHASMRKGVAWPTPRFTDNANGTVTDNLTGLIWLKNAQAFPLRYTWASALTDCATLNSGEMGLSDGSAEGDWRLPNVLELQSLIDQGVYGRALCNTAGTAKWTAGDPFTNVQSGNYWSSTSLAANPDGVWLVDFYNGGVTSDYKATGVGDVWPVRGGQ